MECPIHTPCTWKGIALGDIGWLISISSLALPSSTRRGSLKHWREANLFRQIWRYVRTNKWFSTSLILLIYFCLTVWRWLKDWRMVDLRRWTYNHDSHKHWQWIFSLFLFVCVKMWRTTLSCFPIEVARSLQNRNKIYGWHTSSMHVYIIPHVHAWPGY